MFGRRKRGWRVPLAGGSGRSAGVRMPEQVQLTGGGRPIPVRAGTTIWEAAGEAGIDIRVLCHEPRLRPVGVCRLCVVDVGGRVLAASCVRACEEGMEVQTASPRVEQSRRLLVE